MQTIRNNLDDILKNILLSHIVIKDLPDNNSNKTIIRIHLIPLSETPFTNSISDITQTSNFQNSVLYPQNVVKQKRNLHMSHLPTYRKITRDMLDVSCSPNQLSDNCSICCNSFNHGEYFRTLPICNHVYHKKCIDKWFTKDKNNMRCPICRTSHTKEKIDEFNSE